MKRLSVLLLIIGLCALALIPSRTHAERPDAPQGKLRRNAAAIKNNYIVVFNESVKREQVGEEAQHLARLHGGTIGFTYENALRGFSVEMNEAAAQALSRNPKVAFVEEDAEVQGASTQTNAPWPLDRLDQRTPAPNNSYTYESNGAGVNVYVIDGYYSITKTNLTDARVTVELVQAAGTVSGVETTFKLIDTSTGQHMLFSVRGTLLVMEGNVGAGMIRTTYTYNPAQQRFLRFTHNRMDETMGLSFSPDGKTWTKTALTFGMSFTNAKSWQIHFYAGKSISTAATTTAIFDNLRIERNEGGKTR